MIHSLGSLDVTCLYGKPTYCILHGPDLNINFCISLIFIAMTKQKCFSLVLKSSNAIVTWLKRREGPSADLITDLTQLESLTAEDDLVVLGLFKVIYLIPFVVL